LTSRREYKMLQHGFRPEEVQATHILIGGIVFPWADKAPYVTSGHSTLGALEFNAQQDVVRCHVCGWWFHTLGAHIRKSEGISPSDYRKAYGLNSTTGLCAPSHSKRARKLLITRKKRLTFSREALAKGHRAKRAATPNTAETRNLKNLCQAQIRARVRLLAIQVNGTPTIADLNGAGLSHMTVRRTFQMSISKFMESLGLSRNTSWGRSSLPSEYARGGAA